LVSYSSVITMMPGPTNIKLLSNITDADSINKWTTK